VAILKLIRLLIVRQWRLKKEPRCKYWFRRSGVSSGKSVFGLSKMAYFYLYKRSNFYCKYLYFYFVAFQLISSVTSTGLQFLKS